MQMHTQSADAAGPTVGSPTVLDSEFDMMVSMKRRTIVRRAESVGIYLSLLQLASIRGWQLSVFLAVLGSIVSKHQ